MSHGACFAVGLLMGAWLIWVVNSMSIDPLIDNCEKDLPRTQTCILTAVPKPIEE